MPSTGSCGSTALDADVGFGILSSPKAEKASETLLRLRAVPGLDLAGSSGAYCASGRTLNTNAHKTLVLRLLKVPQGGEWLICFCSGLAGTSRIPTCLARHAAHNAALR